MNRPLADEAVKRLRAAGLVLPRAPRPGERWAPRTDAEQHLLREAQRLDQVRQALLAEVGRLRQAAGYRSGAQVREDAAREADRLRECPLTPALLKVIQAAVEGWPPDEVAERLGIAPRTLRNHRHRILMILGAGSFDHAVALSVWAGWVQPAPSGPRTGVVLG